PGPDAGPAQRGPGYLRQRLGDPEQPLEVLVAAVQQVPLDKVPDAIGHDNSPSLPDPHAYWSTRQLWAPPARLATLRRGPRPAGPRRPPGRRRRPPRDPSARTGWRRRRSC